MNWELGGSNPFGQDVGFGYLDRSMEAPKRRQPRLILNTPDDDMLRNIRAELRRCSSFFFSVAFVSPQAIALLKQELIDFEGPGTIVTSDYLGFNSPHAFYELLNLRQLGVDVRLHGETAFHPKGYVFQRPDGLTAILGSSNLTASALVSTHEWNIRVSAATESDLAEQFSNLLDAQILSSAPITVEWVERYERSYSARPVVAGRQPGRGDVEIERDELEHRGTLEPNAMQVEALSSIQSLRESGKTKALIISATGTGKTILSALDVRQARARRVLFVAHREQILDRAIYEFSRVLGAPDSDFGKLAGPTRELNRPYVFATIQTLSRPDVLDGLDPAAFDYILIDEVHRAGADSYARVVQHFLPKFLLGMTATPERPDGINIFELFEYNVPYEIRLRSALELDMLAPFHYYGVADYEFNDGHTTSESTPLFRLVSQERVHHVLVAIEKYGQSGVRTRGLIFCSRKEEAYALAAELNTRELRGHRLRTLALTGSDSIEERERAVERLEAGELDYLVTVDVFNEGVDIPSVNQVVMLRQTQSSIVFTQQLGRGLRKATGKEYLVVIDFIGNYANNYMIPIALFGDDSLNKESLRKNLIAAEEAGVLPGLSSVRFDRIAQERVLRSLADAKIDSWHNIKAAIDTVRNRLGRVPALYDFLRFESADPVMLATKLGNYPSLLQKLLNVESTLTQDQTLVLNQLSSDVLSTKRLHDVVLLRLALRTPDFSRGDIAETFRSASLPYSDNFVTSAIGTLTQRFNVEVERKKFGRPPIQESANGTVSLDPHFADWYRTSAEFSASVDDLVRTGLELTASRYDKAEPFTRGLQYSRKDASRLLNWPTNQQGILFGYKVDAATATCPIFVTLNKADSVSESTAYEDELLDQSVMLWYSRSRRTLLSGEVRAIVENSVDLHILAKKSDADGSDFYYLGRAHAEDAEQTTMPSGLDIVRMHLRFEVPIDTGLFDYFHPVATAF